MESKAISTYGNYDMRIEIDEDEIDFSGSPIPTY